MELSTSETLFARACQLIPGGVNSPVRAFGSVGGTPRFIRRAQGAYLWDEDGNRYLDMVGSWGPMILGHGHPRVVEALAETLTEGISFGAPTEREVVLAQLVLERYPSCDRIRFVNSGTEATMSAIRVARGATEREAIIKFAGNYHGHADSLLVAAGSGALTTGVPSSAGITRGTASTTLVARYNDLTSVEELFRANPGQVAAVIIEPVAGNMGVVPPEADFLPRLSELAHLEGALLIVDEVMTGCRLASGGAVERYRLEPDLVCWGKIIGGGLPVGAYGGKATLMEQVSPLGKVYQAGTLSGNPLAMAAGIATLETINDQRDFYHLLEERGAKLEAGLHAAAAAAGIASTINRVGSMLTVFFGEHPVNDYQSARRSDTATFRRWFHGLLSRGIYWPPSAFEAAFLSYAHGPEEIEILIRAAADAFLELRA